MTSRLRLASAAALVAVLALLLPGLAAPASAGPAPATTTAAPASPSSAATPAARPSKAAARRFAREWGRYVDRGAWRKVKARSVRSVSIDYVRSYKQMYGKYDWGKLGNVNTCEKSWLRSDATVCYHREGGGMIHVIRKGGRFKVAAFEIYD